jgi:hypothetical protein
MCTLKHSNQKENVLHLNSKFKEAVSIILYQLDQNKLNYSVLNFNELTDLLEKGNKELLDEIVRLYEKIDLTNIVTRLNQQEQNAINIPLIRTDLNEKWSGMKNNFI